MLIFREKNYNLVWTKSHFMILFTILTTLSSLLAVIVAMGAIYYSNKNNQKQILVGKYEELFETVIQLASYHDIFINLSFQADMFKDPSIRGRKIVTIEQYNAYRDKHLPPNEVEQIRTYLSKLEVLRKCYTKKSLYEKCEEYNSLMFAFFMYTVYPISAGPEIHYDQLPQRVQFLIGLEGFKKEIIAQIEAL